MPKRKFEFVGLSLFLLFCLGSLLAGSSNASPNLDAPLAAVQQDDSEVGHLQISPMAQPLQLAQNNKIAFGLLDCQPTDAFVDWNRYLINGTLLGTDVEAVSGTTSIMRGQDGVPYLEVMPLMLGKLQLKINVLCQSGKWLSRSVDVLVTLPDTKPTRFFVATRASAPRKAGVVIFSMAEFDRQAFLFFARYPDAPKPAQIDRDLVKVTIITPSGLPPVIEVDKATHRIKALSYGHALLETSFEGLVDLTCVNVVEDARVAMGSNCSELVPPDSIAPPIESLPSDSPPSIHIAPRR